MHGAGGKIIRCRMDVLEEVYSFYDGFKGEKGVFGFSEEGRPLVYFLAGKGAPVLLAQYAMHAREYVTAYVALEEIKYLSERDIEGSVYVLPLVNPDGVRIALTRDKLWKANAKGVDLNVNFDARWGTGAQNKRTAGASDYIGEYPFSAAESAALRNFTLRVMPDMTVSYHTKGEEIYWYFYQQGERAERDRALAEAAASLTGYAVRTPFSSAGGYKDWCVEKLSIPAITIEAGADWLPHPIGKERAAEIFRKNKDVPLELIRRLKT